MTEQSPRFTCVIPTHGRPHLLADALQSVVSQRNGMHLLGAIIVVIDDDNLESRRLVARVASENPGLDLRAIDSDRLPQGAAQSRNVGASAGSDPYIAFLDDDDLWLPDHLSNTASVLHAHSSDAPAVVSSRRTMDENGELAHQPTLDTRLVSIDHAYSAGSVVTGSNLVIARSVFDSLGGYDANLPVMNDTDLFVRLLQAGHTPLISVEVSVVMRIHSGDQLTRPNIRRATGMRTFYDKHRSAMTASQRRHFRYRMLGMHRLAARSPLLRVYYTALQATNAHPARVFQRLGSKR